MLDEKSGWALVPGSTKPKETKMKVKAVLKFWAGGKLIEPGEEIEVDESLAREVVQSGKATAVSGDVVATDSVAATAEALAGQRTGE